jgi:hypothetical protein
MGRKVRQEARRVERCPVYIAGTVNVTVDTHATGNFGNPPDSTVPLVSAYTTTKVADPSLRHRPPRAAGNARPRRRRGCKIPVIEPGVNDARLALRVSLAMDTES